MGDVALFFQAARRGISRIMEAGCSWHQFANQDIATLDVVKCGVALAAVGDLEGFDSFRESSNAVVNGR
jgi:S-adenosylmethionine/arginine decarboxylase-like enzyme